MAAFVKSVERVTFTFAASSSLDTQTVNLSKGQDHAMCVPFHTARFLGAQADGRGANACSFEMIDNAGTPAVRGRHINAGSPMAQMRAEVYVVEFDSDKVWVDSGTFTMTSFTHTIEVVSGREVDESRTFIVFNLHANISSTADDFNDLLIRIESINPFAGDTDANFARGAGGAPDFEVYYYVVESKDGDFQVEVASPGVASNATTFSHTLSNAVTLANAFLIPTYSTTEFADDLRDAIWNFALTGTTTLEGFRDHGGTTPSAGTSPDIFVVRTDSAGAAVQRFDPDVDGQLVTNQAVTPVDADKAVVLNSHHVQGGAWATDGSLQGGDVAPRQSTVHLDSVTNARIERQDDTALDGTNNRYRFEVVEFELTGGAGAQDLTGTLYVDPDTFHGGTVAPGPVDLDGSVYTDPDVFHGGTVEPAPQDLDGTLYVDPDTFPGGTVAPGPVALDGSVYTDPDTFHGGTVAPGAVALEGSVYVDPDTFHGGTVQPGAQALDGTVYVDPDVFPGGTVVPGAVSLAGTLYTDPDVFHGGAIQREGVLEGTLYIDPDVFPGGDVAPGAVDLDGTAFVDPDAFHGGEVVPAQLLEGSRYTDPDSFRPSTVTTGPVTLDGAAYADPDTFGASDVVPGAVALVGTVYADPDTFHGGLVLQGIQLTGSLYIDPDLFGGSVIITGPVTITGSLYVDPDVFHGGALQFEAQDLDGALYVDPDAFLGGIVAPGPVNLLGFLGVDPDFFHGGTVSLSLQELIATAYQDPDLFGASVVFGGSPPGKTPFGGLKQPPILQDGIALWNRDFGKTKRGGTD